MRKRNKFSLSHTKLLSMNMGQIVPIGLTEVIPGDTFQGASTAFVRVSPLVAPVMHPVNVVIHHWFVPTRIIWDDFEDFITGGPDGLNTDTVPTIYTASGYSVGSLQDYMGLPPNKALRHSALPFRAYELIYNECYRDQDLQPEVPIYTGTSENPSESSTSYKLQWADWEKDYFTTARPWPQKGPDVTVPVSGGSDIQGAVTISGNGAPKFITTSDQTPATLQRVYGSGGDDSGLLEAVHQGKYTMTATGDESLAWSDPALKAALSITGGELGSISINSLREAYAIQKFEEARAMYGSRYVEYLRYLGIKSSDARLQRPEYLGGGRQTIQFSEVLQTAEGTDPVGTLRGHGIGAMRTNRFMRFFEEHGYILSLMIVRPKAIYTDGCPRLFNRRYKEDFFNEHLQHIGDQEVQQQEIFVTGQATNKDSSKDEATWGYQRRYDEYRRHESSVSGEFRKTLDYWHMARMFDNSPVLNADFVKCQPTNRIYASTATDQLYVMVQNTLRARRMISK